MLPCVPCPAALQCCQVDLLASFQVATRRAAMQCPQCQHENAIDAKFCDNCGSPFVGTCSGCGTENRPGARFCKECGASFRASTSALSPFQPTQPQPDTEEPIPCIAPSSDSPAPARREGPLPNAQICLWCRRCIAGGDTKRPHLQRRGPRSRWRGPGLDR